MQEPQKPLYQQIVTQSDPNNGFEDYLRACDLHRSLNLGALEGWTPDRYEQLLADKKAVLASPSDAESWDADDEAALEAARKLDDNSYLTIYRMIAARTDKVVDLIRLGNGKKVYDPRTDFDVATSFPELAEVKSLSKLLLLRAYVHFADGNSSKATSELLDGITMAQKMSGTTFISNLVSVACTAIALAGFNENLSALSQPDAARIEKYVSNALRKPTALIAALNNENENMTKSWLDLIKSPADLSHISSDDETPAPAHAQFEQFAAKLSAAQFKELLAAFQKKLGEATEASINVLNGSEDKWLDRNSYRNFRDPQTISNIDDAAEYLALNSALDHRQLVLAAIRGRTQLRLLGLHARILDYKWNNRKLPEKLEDAVPAPLLHDPMSGQNFVYTVSPKGYELYSLGSEDTGRVDLKYNSKYARAAQGDDTIPPPLRVRQLLVNQIRH